jgi:hypothetical protein
LCMAHVRAVYFIKSDVSALTAAVLHMRLELIQVVLIQLCMYESLSGTKIKIPNAKS